MIRPAGRVGNFFQNLADRVGSGQEVVEKIIRQLGVGKEVFKSHGVIGSGRPVLFF